MKKSSYGSILFILAAIQFTHIMDFMIMMPLQEHLVPVFHITPAQFSHLVSSYAFAAFVTSLLASFISDRFDRKKILLFGYFGFALGTLSCAFAPNLHALLFARIAAGAFGGIIAGQGMADKSPQLSHPKPTSIRQSDINPRMPNFY